VAVFVPGGVVLFGLDDTIERRRGDQITPKASTVIRALLACVCCQSQWPALAQLYAADPLHGPIESGPALMTVLCPPSASTHSTAAAIKPCWTRLQIIRLVTRWLPGRELVFVADSSFAAWHGSTRLRGCPVSG